MSLYCCGYHLRRHSFIWAISLSWASMMFPASSLIFGSSWKLSWPSLLLAGGAIVSIDARSEGSRLAGSCG